MISVTMACHSTAACTVAIKFGDMRMRRADTALFQHMINLMPAYLGRGRAPPLSLCPIRTVIHSGTNIRARRRLHPSTELKRHHLLLPDPKQLPSLAIF